MNLINIYSLTFAILTLTPALRYSQIAWTGCDIDVVEVGGKLIPS